MPFTRNTVIVNNITNQPNQPVISATALKALFDQSDVDQKSYDNSVLLPELESTVDGDSGLDNIGMTPIAGLVATTPQQALEEIVAKTPINVLNGSITDLKLSNAPSDLKQRFANLKIVNVLDFGAVGDGIADDTAALLLAKQSAVANLPSIIYFPKGTYNYTNLGNLAYSDLTLQGQSSSSVVLKCTNTDNDNNAIFINAFESGSDLDPFVQRMNFKNITVQGNNKTINGFNVQGLARCNWENVLFKECKNSNGVAFNFKGFMLSSFKNIICSTDLTQMTNIPSVGLKLTNGIRNVTNVGNASNNTFTSCYFEGMTKGIQLDNADQNTFIGGSAESCSAYGMTVNSTCRYNTFIGTGFENSIATADVDDAGLMTHYTNCYTSKSFVIQGKLINVNGGLHERIDIKIGAVKSRIENVYVNSFTSGSGGYFDVSSTTEFKNIYDFDTSNFIYPLKDRTGITVGASPFEWQNTTGVYVEVIIQTGTITQILGKRGTDQWLSPITVPGKILVAPLDKINVSYSVAPSMSYLPQNGL